MEIFGIGLQELILVFLVAIIVMGPKDMQKAGRTFGKWLRNIVTSDGWRIFQQTSRELRTLPNRLMREASEELQQAEREAKKAIGDPLREFASPARSQPFSQPGVRAQTPETNLPTQESAPHENA